MRSPHRTTKGATATEYSLMLALIGAIAVGTVFTMGLTVEDTLTSADAGLNEGLDAGLGTGNGGGNGGGGQNAGAIDVNGCYVESGGDSVSRFDAASPVTCFSIANGNDVLETGRAGTLTIEAANGPKTLELNGAGQHMIELANVPSGALNVGQATVAATDSSVTVVAGGRLELDAAGAAAPWTITAAGGNDSVVLRDGARLANVVLGAGNDGFTFSSLTGTADNGDVAPGFGTNTLAFQCSNGSVDWTNTSPLWPTLIGNDSITTSCPLYVQAPANDPLTGDPVVQADLDFVSTAASAYLTLSKESPFNVVSIVGPVAASTGIRIDTLQSRQLGPITVDIDVTGDHTAPGPNGPRSVTQVTLNADLGADLVGPDVPSNQPATVSIDTSGVHGAGFDSYTAVVLNRPTAQQSVALTGGTAGSRHIHLDLPDPNVIANTGIPSLSSDAPVSMAVILEGCGDITLHAKAGSGRSDVVITDAACQANNFQPINNVAFASELPFYEGLTVARASGSTLEMGFNGGALPNGSSLDIINLVFGLSSRQDVSGGAS
jgi:Flp pilus assembly pilin Flp